MKKNQEQNFKLFYNNRKYLLFTVLLIWLCGVLALFVIKPQLAKIKEIRSEHGEKNSELELLVHKRRELAQVLTSDEFQKKEKVDEVLPSHKPLLELLTNLNQAAKKTKISFVNLELNPGLIASPAADLNLEDKNTSTRTRQAKKSTSNTNKNYDYIEVSLAIKGQTQNVEEFMRVLEKIAPLTTITDFNINNQEKTRQELQSSTAADLSQVSTATMTILTYYYTQTIKISSSSRMPSVGEEELAIFEKIQELLPSDFQMQTTLQSTDLEDIFGIENLVEKMK